MKRVTYPLRLDEVMFQRVELEAKRRHVSLADICREVIALGLSQLPAVPDAALDGLIAETWEKLGPAPEIDYEKI